MDTAVLATSSHTKTKFNIDGREYNAILFHSWSDPLFPEIPGTSIFLSKEYHAALSAAPPEKMKFHYVRLESSDGLIGMLCFQIEDFNPGDSLKNQVNGKVMSLVKYKLASMINLKVLCLGNTLVTGDYGFCFKEDVDKKLRTLLMMETIDWMLGVKPFHHIGLVFVKDFYEDIFKEIPDSPHCSKYHFIDTQPSMIMDIRKEWKNLDGYLNSLKSKYRVRARKALSSALELERIELNVDEIEEIEDQLHNLYLKVVDDVGFNLFILSVGYFTELKRKLGDRFHLWIYRDKGELISFFTVFEDGDILDAHFLGYDPEMNHRHKLYMNMLLAMIDYATTNGFRQLQLSRTATEIKSSVGAEGIPMWAYMRSPKKSLNWLIPKVYSFFKPDLDWVARHPFPE
ncbi:MAG TPA: GNAT family N-acetyltransferase [Saprospiraceae bacterium]|nr:GNAT family N-acetyltransferase [Saprospiraceae bacterium]